MWRWRRKEPDSPSRPATAPAVLPVTRAEWRSLPPIQRVVAEHPLINPVQRFSSSLTSWRSPAYLEPLGHRVGPAEPAGVIGGHARAPMPAPDMPVVQRSARKRGVLSRLWGMSVQRDAEPGSPVAESPAPELESTTLHPDEPGPVLAPTPAFVLPVVAAASREADRPTMPSPTADPPVRTVQAVRQEAPMPPAHPRISAVEQSPVDSPAPSELPLVDTATPDHGTVDSEPEPADTRSFETVPVQPVPDSAQLSVIEPAASAKAPGEPMRPALPVVQRTEQAAPSPRRLGLGAPIVPDAGEPRTPVSPPAGPATVEPAHVESTAAEPEPMATEPEPPVPAAEDSAAEPDAPLTGAVETPVLPALPAEETAPVPDDVPRPVARIAEGAERIPPAGPVETPTLGTSATVSRTSAGEAVQRSVVESALEVSSPKRQAMRTSAGEGVQRSVVESALEMPSSKRQAMRTSAADAVQRSVVESALEMPSPKRQAMRTSAGEGVQRSVVESALEVSSPKWQGMRTSAGEGVQRSVVESALEVSSPKRQDLPTVFKPVQRLRDESPLPGPAGAGPPGTLEEGAPIAISSRSSPITTFESPEAAEPPGTPGGSVSASSPPERTAPLPVARAIEGATVTSPVPASRPTLTGQAGGSAQLPTLTVSRTVEARRNTNPPPSVRVLDSPAPPKIEPSPEPRTTSTVLLTVASPREDGAVAQPSMTTLPVSRIADRPDPAPRPLLPRNGNPVTAEGTGPLPVARIAEAAPPVQTGRPSTMDILRTVQRTAQGETVDHGTGLVLNVPPVVVSRQSEAPVLQREPEAPPPEPVAPPVTTPAAAAVPAAQPETEELVKKLFDPLLRRLKTELRLDRERRGALTDRPH
ncbi:hypothetical protein [Amycolatopsis roodepoortensis]|uniref:hypothetical protein n=1 Tax=Amycolatopsis roodepoortensis TaxID=700274 RepID=UPI0035315671